MSISIPPEVAPALPRLIFAGRFLCDVSTVNNDPQHYDTQTFRPSYQLPYPDKDPDADPRGWWNPLGTGSFALTNCTPTTITYADGTTATSPAEDPALALSICGTRDTVQGKCVNLDPQMQDVFELWGLRFSLGTPDLNTPHLSGHILPTALIDNWKNVTHAEGTDVDPHALGTRAGVWYCPLVLNNFEANNSRFLQECESFLSTSKDAPKGRFVVRLYVDAFDTDRLSAGFPYGRVVASVTPYVSGDPLHLDSARRLVPSPLSSLSTSAAYARIHRRKDGDHVLNVHVGNALALSKKAGPYQDIGVLRAVALRGESPQDGFDTIGTIDYMAPEFYTETAGVVDLPMKHVDVANKARIALIATSNGFDSILVAERSDGITIRADSSVFRLNTGDAVDAYIYAWQYGKPLRKTVLSIHFDSTIMKAQATQGPIPGPEKVGEPISALQLTGNAGTSSSDADDGRISIFTDESGKGTLHLKGGTPGNPRSYIDGQVYGLSYDVGHAPPSLGIRDPTCIVSVLLFDEYKVPSKPTWLGDVAPVLLQYAQLYPAMKRVVNLANYGDCLARIYPLYNAFSANEHDPHYMPVTRDLSQGKKDMILKWIGDPADATTNPPLYMDHDSVRDLRIALQTAIELEHATLPPYLTALYSIKPGYNQEVADIIRSVTIEEMLHFSIACNLLISIGGHPNINKPGFVPTYPGTLPGGLRRGLNVRLRKCSIEQLKSFMSIEEPEKLVLSENGVFEPAPNRTEMEKYTIGFLYDEIAKSLASLYEAEKITFGNSDDQLEGWSHPGTLKKVLSLKDALEGIKEIKEQGEGANPLNPFDGLIDPTTGLKEISHYYKFAEIVNGRRLIAEKIMEKNGQRDRYEFSFTGDPITLDERGVYNMMDDPDMDILPKGTQQRSKAENFARRYRAMLNGLHHTMNGHPEHIVKSIAAMFQLTISAGPLMQLDSLQGDRTTVGLSFQLPIGN